MARQAGEFHVREELSAVVSRRAGTVASFASILINAGRLLRELRRILWHSQIVTMQCCAHLRRETPIPLAWKITSCAAPHLAMHSF